MAYDIKLVERERETAAVVSGSVAHDGIPAFLSAAFDATLEAIRSEGSHPTGMPLARYALTETGFDIEAGFPCAVDVSDGAVRMTELPGGGAAETLHIGPYSDLAGAYHALEAWIADHGMVPAGTPWESYLDEPGVAEPRTIVTWPCRPRD